MPRIAGLLTLESHKPAPRIVTHALVAQNRDKSERTSLSELGSACLGWRGDGFSNLYQCDRVAVVVDGEFYNRQELPKAKNAASIFRSLYLAHGFSAALEKVNGDFAIALYDQDLDRCWLARDRIGVKPLYYAKTDLGLAFASQPAGLLSLPGVGWEINESFAGRYAGSHYRYIDNDIHASPFSSVAQLPAGHCLRVDGRRHHTVQRYWSLTERPDWEVGEEELAERYRALLVDAVSIRCSGDSRPAFTLSGGMDSSSVIACAVHATGSKQTAVSSVYKDKTFDESDDIRTILADVAEDWIQVEVDQPDVFELVREMVAIHNEPVATATWLSHFSLCGDVAKRGFQELFGGLGGDELNAGEYEYFLYHFADLDRSGMSERLNTEIECWAEYHDHPVFTKNRNIALAEIDRLTDRLHPGFCRPDRRRLERYASALNRERFDVRAYVPKMDHPFGSYLKNRTFHDMFRETTPCCLRAEDRHGAHFGLEHRLPFLDYRLTEFMFRVPGDLKIRDGVTKHLLRKATRGILPDETRNRIKKTGWNAPAHVWFTGASREPLLDLIHSRRFKDGGFYDTKRVTEIVQDHEDIVSNNRVEENHMMFLWQLVNLQMWMDWVDSNKHAANDSGKAPEFRTTTESSEGP